MEVEARLKELRKEQTELTQRMSVLALQSILIFGIPALCGYFVGVYLEHKGVVKALAYVGPLALTFIFSWIVLMKKLNSFKKETERIELEIRELAPPIVMRDGEELAEKEDLK